MISPLAQPPIPKPARRNRLGRFILILFLVAAVAAGSVLSQGVTPPGRSGDALALVESAWDVALSKVGETPNLAPNPWPGEIIFCEPLPESQRRAFADGVALMRSTENGAALFQMLQDEGVCIGVEDLPYNSAYATSRWTPGNGWAESEIRIDTSYVTFLYPDVLAAILVHEATHIERAITRTSCYYADACTVLPNGVYLEEEVVAHSAEAEFWIALFGRDGKDRALANDHAENQLKAFYLQGPDAFLEFVREMRSDSREGDGIG
ncbi:MAG: hypothetical protein KF883_12620 [Thermomicrobiales bacterium]|nr:hypothetical protein [Thermomicrobiales bacterium]